jgi:hypothetical protein
MTPTRSLTLSEKARDLSLVKSCTTALVFFSEIAGERVGAEDSSDVFKISNGAGTIYS